jgi:hypothetical protein
MLHNYGKRLFYKHAYGGRLNTFELLVMKTWSYFRHRKIKTRLFDS